MADPIRLSCVQLFVCGTLTAIPMILFDIRGDAAQWSASLKTWQAWLPILYAGILSCGIAYTLQIVAQPKLNPTVASLVMSLESVFAVIAGAVFLNEQMSVRELIGCAVMFAAIILVQIPIKQKQKSNKQNNTQA